MTALRALSIEEIRQVMTEYDRQVIANRTETFDTFRNVATDTFGEVVSEVVDVATSLGFVDLSDDAVDLLRDAVQDYRTTLRARLAREAAWPYRWQQ